MTETLLLQKPSPHQLFKLSAMVICLAKEHHELNLGEYFGYQSQTFLGRVARRGFNDNKQYSMHLVDRVWNVSDEFSSSSRTTYKFDWGGKDVNRATRIVTTAIENEEKYDFSLHAETVDDIFFQPDLLGAVIEHQRVSSADCKLLLNEVGAFIQESRTRFAL